MVYINTNTLCNSSLVHRASPSTHTSSRVILVGLEFSLLPPNALRRNNLQARPRRKIVVVTPTAAQRRPTNKAKLPSTYTLNASALRSRPHRSAPTTEEGHYSEALPTTDIRGPKTLRDTSSDSFVFNRPICPISTLGKTILPLRMRTYRGEPSSSSM